MYYRHNLDYIPYGEAVNELRVYRIMQEMNGIHPGDPTYNEDQKIDNYHKTMG